jgi:hypothetical protein
VTTGEEIRKTKCKHFGKMDNVEAYFMQIGMAQYWGQGWKYIFLLKIVCYHFPKGDTQGFSPLEIFSHLMNYLLHCSLFLLQMDTYSIETNIHFYILSWENLNFKEIVLFSSILLKNSDKDSQEMKKISNYTYNNSYRHKYDTDIGIDIYVLVKRKKCLI